jgi:hypothetical protein
MNVFVNLFGRAGTFSVKDGKSNLRGRSLTDRSRHSSFHLNFLWKEGKKERRKEGKKEGRSVVPARSLQLLVGTTFLICWVIPKAFLLAYFTLLYPEEMFKIPAPLQVMNKCSLFQNNTTFLVWFLLTGFNLLFLSALDGNAIKITDTNFTELHQLCDEFGFSELATKL